MTSRFSRIQMTLNMLSKSSRALFTYNIIFSILNHPLKRSASHSITAVATIFDLITHGLLPSRALSSLPPQPLSVPPLLPFSFSFPKFPLSKSFRGAHLHTRIPREINIPNKIKTPKMSERIMMTFYCTHQLQYKLGEEMDLLFWAACQVRELLSVGA
jgi:hypothetical protein